MRRSLDKLLIASALALSSCTMQSPAPPPPLPPDVSPPPGRSLTELSFPRDIEHGPLGPNSENESGPRELLFQAADAAGIDGSRLVLDVWVTNPTAERVVLHVVPVGGSFPYGGESPLTLAFGPEARSIVTYAGEIFPPEPPTPMWLALPATSRVLFRAELDAGNYTYDGHPSVTLEWAFHLLRGEARRGTVNARLP